MTDGQFPGGPPDPSLATQSLVPEVITCAVLTTLVAGAAVAARFYARWRILDVVGTEDWLIFVAFVLSLAFAIATIISSQHGLGRHVWTISFEDMMVYVLVSYIGIWFYQLSLLFSKLSILMLYLRVLTYSGARYIVMVVIAFVVGYNIWGMYALATQCTPAAAAWDIRVAAEPGVRCRGNDHLWTVVSLHISSDFIIFSIPLPIVWRLRMPLRRKVGLLGVFALGFFVCVISILRAIFIDQALKNSDFSWAFVSVANWSMAEPNIAIVVPCLVVMKPLTSRAWSSFRSLTLRVMPPDSSSSRNGGANGPVSGEGAGGRARSKDSYPTDRSGSDGSHGDGAGSNREPDLALFELGGSLEAQQQPSNHGLPDGNHRHHVTVARAESEQSDPEVYVDADSKRAAGCSSLDDKKGLSSAATSSAGAATTGDAGPKKLSVMHHTAANDGVECAGSRFRRLWRKW